LYKLTFDDKPEANTYIKWASQKGYKVEGPFREKLAKNAKKFDLNGKQRKYSYVVIRKRGGAPGAGGGEVKQETPLYPTRGAAEHERSVRLGAGHKDVFVRPHHKKGLAGGVEGYSVESTPPERGAKTVKLQSGEPKTKATEEAAAALRSSFEEKALPEPKKRGRPKKKGAVDVASIAKESPISKLIDAQAKAAAEAQERQKTFIGAQKARERAKGVIERDIARQKAKSTAAETVAAEWEARGETPPEQVDIMARAAERERTRKEEAEREAKFIGTVGEPQTPGQKRRYEEVRALKREAEAPEKTRAKLIEDAVKARRAEDLRTAREGKRASKAAKKTAARQESARKYVVKQYLKEGRQLPEGVSDYVTEKEKFQTEKAEAIGRKKAARIETAKQAQKYQQKVAPEEGKWTYAEAQAKAKEMAKEKVPGRPLIKIGKRVIMSADEQKRKTYILRGKKPGEYKVVAGTKEELETPTSLKAALAKEKRKFKKRKKLLEKPLREIRRAKKVLRTSSRHIARQILRKPSSLVPTRGRHPAIGNVSMEYHAARIAQPILVPKSIAGTYLT